MSELYADTNIRISEIVGRKYNNPLGPKVLDFLIQEASINETSLILDVGSGRGVMPIALWEKTKAQIVGLEPSGSMLKEAIALASRTKASIQFFQSGLYEWEESSSFYDAIISFDVLSYMEDRVKTIQKLRRLLNKKGYIFYSDYYFSDEKPGDYTQSLLNAWQIHKPGSKRWHEELLISQGFEVISIKDTSDLYWAHWDEVRKKVEENSSLITQELGQNAYDQYRNSVHSILSAVKYEGFGHCLVLAKFSPK